MVKACVIRATGGGEPDYWLTWHESVAEAREICRKEYEKYCAENKALCRNVIDEGEDGGLSCWADCIYGWFVEVIPE